jgi:YHS domain-containing protein
MRKAAILFSVAAFLLFAANLHAAEEKEKAEKDPEGLFKSQTHCPVMGGEIDSTVYTDIQGQRVYHCCPMCSDKLKADPDKYFKKSAGQGILYENIQTSCPVSGEKVNDSVFVDYDGRRVHFCCEMCIADFAKKPNEYLLKLDKAAAADKEAEEQPAEEKSDKMHMH